MKDNVKELLIKMGCENIEHYTLVNNTGYTFTRTDIKYDVRHWRNCYGAELDIWNCMPLNEEYDPQFVRVLNNELKHILSEE